MQLDEVEFKRSNDVEFKRLRNEFESSESQKTLTLDLKITTTETSPFIDYKIKFILRYLIEKLESSKLSDVVEGCNFVTSRSTLKFFEFNWKANWTIIFTKFQNIIFFSLVRKDPAQVKTEEVTGASKQSVSTII
jgi:hypothetical protein